MSAIRLAQADRPRSFVRPWSERRFSFLPWALVATLLAWAPGCNRASHELEETGDSNEFQIDGLRSLIERVTVVSDARVLAVGRSGPRLRARILWADRSGEVLFDHELSQVERPEGFAGCIERDNADLLMTVANGEQTQVVIARVRGDALAEPTEVVLDSPGPVQLESVGGPSETCGLCLYQTASEQLTCRLGMGESQGTSWSTGALGHWEVLRVGERLILADWSADDEGWVTVRLGRLSSDGSFEWLQGYTVAQLPTITNPEEQALAHPRFVASNDVVTVFFVDGTDWFTRLFVQRFPLDGEQPSEPVLLESCRGTCRVYWSERFDDATWIWYRDQTIDWAERISDAGERSRSRFSPPPNVETLGRGLFKMGLGNDVANWWALLEYER